MKRRSFLGLLSTLPFLSMFPWIKATKPPIFGGTTVHGYTNFPPIQDTFLRKSEWIELDGQVLKAARFRLRSWANLSFHVRTRLNSVKSSGAKVWNQLRSRLND